MRHRKSGRKLKRTASHRRALLSALSTALLRYKRITTTVAKAKETRMVVEKIITRAKNAVAKAEAAPAGDAPARRIAFEKAAGHARREVGRLIKDREVVSELFGAIAEKVATRPGGYTRIVKLGQRMGDGAEMAVIELVDFNTGKDSGEKPAAAKEKKEKQQKRSSAARAGKKGKKEKREKKEKKEKEAAATEPPAEKKSGKDVQGQAQRKESH
jgi:large subunit ribosomal protein L17